MPGRNLTLCYQRISLESWDFFHSSAYSLWIYLVLLCLIDLGETSMNRIRIKKPSAELTASHPSRAPISQNRPIILEIFEMSSPRCWTSLCLEHSSTSRVLLRTERDITSIFTAICAQKEGNYILVLSNQDSRLNSYEGLSNLKVLEICNYFMV